MLFEQKRKRVTQKGLWVTLKRLSSKDWTHPNPPLFAFECPLDILIEPLSTPIKLFHNFSSFRLGRMSPGHSHRTALDPY